MDTATGALSALRRLGIAIAIAAVFLFGLATTVYLSLRSPEVRVPDVLGKDRFEAEQVLGEAGLNFRIRATRPSSELKADTVLFQVPRAGEVVKAGQTIAMDISRTVKEGESSEVSAPEKQSEAETRNSNSQTSDNENKARRNKNTNKNANDNSNANSGNRNANSNRPGLDQNANGSNANKATNENSNRPALINTNSRNGSNQNSSERPATAKPSPVSKPTKENQ